MRWLTIANTTWLFISSSEEERHLLDIVFGYQTLVAIGVDPSRIYIFVDHPLPDIHLNPYGISRIHALEDIRADVIQVASTENVVLIVGGHGSHQGLGSGHLTADQILKWVRTIPNIELGLIVLTQCYAGIFNFLDALSSPKLVFIGATNLHPSVSIAIRLPDAMPLADGSRGNDAWSANIFSLGFFHWLRRPLDIDGDGATNLLDAYKFSGVFSSEELRSNKCHTYQRIQQLYEELRDRERIAESDVALQFDMGAIRTRLQQELVFLNIHQEPWLLNANLAREVVFCLSPQI
jgi:hypothetical protein